MNWIDVLIVGYILFLFLLNLYPIVNKDAESWISFVNYSATLIAIYESYIHEQWKFITLILTTLIIHLVTDSCKIEESCISMYNESDFAVLEQYFTLYGLLHLIFYVSFSTKTVEIFVPILVFVSLITVNLAVDSITLILIATVCFINLLSNKHEYHLIDIIFFLVFTFLAGLFYFLKVDKDVTNNVEGNGIKRFFLYFYFLAFSISTGIKKEGVVFSMRLFSRVCGQVEKTKDNENKFPITVLIPPQKPPKNAGYSKVATIERADLYKNN